MDLSGKRLFCYYLGYGKWMVGGAINNAGTTLKWLKDKILKAEKHIAGVLEGDVYEILCKEASLSSPVPKGLIFLPFLTGERFPIRDPYANGVLFGLRVSVDRRDIVRSALEGIAFTLRWIYEALKGVGVKPIEVRIGGGGARSKLWREIIANVLNVRLSYTGYENATLLGGLIYALRALGYYEDLNKAIRDIVEGGLTEVTEPDEVLSKRYLKAFELFKRIYLALKDISKYHYSSIIAGGEDVR